ncbi:MAG: hypothetical protein IIC67_11495 [Thaumarchaeota archaeon]|nr:hypothetical protein [Nitrososphaerota archaeon]
MSFDIFGRTSTNIQKQIVCNIYKQLNSYTKTVEEHYCKNCETEFDNPPKIKLEESTNEKVADNLILVERGQYTCEKCSSIIGEYRVFKKNDESSEVGNATPSE